MKEDKAFSGTNEEDIQMNEMLNGNVPESIISLENPAMVQQASCCQSNQDDCKQWLCGK
jgi:hypothetical protein